LHRVAVLRVPAGVKRSTLVKDAYIAKRYLPWQAKRRRPERPHRGLCPQFSEGDALPDRSTLATFAMPATFAPARLIFKLQSGSIVMYTKSNAFVKMTQSYHIRNKEHRRKMQPKFTSTLMEETEKTIVDLYNRRRDGLSVREWGELYKLVMPVLERTRLPEFFWSQEEREDLVNSFFERKIFRNAKSSHAAPIVQAYQLKAFLKNYAIAHLRARAMEAKTTVSAEIETDRIAAAEASYSSIEKILSDAGIALDKAVVSAKGFIDSLSELHRAYLSNDTCADEREGIVHIAHRLDARSYHYQAQKLGITRPGDPPYSGYESTRIGGWLVELLGKDILAQGGALDPDWREEYAALLKLLCYQIEQRVQEEGSQ
jgi:hypothetical protein